uniref:Uncharacterized protein n=1 Tax=Candolleomyces aberdarensis TaxID=2316362 RepID=A0A4Q2DNF1_9AGAR
MQDRPSKAGTSAAAQSRRAQNAASRADDVEFSFEIGSGLLAEVRRLQSLLAERDKTIQDLKEEKDDLDRTLENLRGTLRQQEQQADTLKEENWNLEVLVQDLRNTHAAHRESKLEIEVKKLNRHLTSMQDQFDQFKNEAEILQTHLEEFSANRETDIAQVKRVV